jgi:hypothetical protein
MTGAAAPGGFVGWVLQYGQIVAFIAQLLYWIVIAAMAVWATMLFKRLVDFRTGVVAGGVAEKEPVKVEEFTD